MHEKMAIPALILLALFCLLVACTINEPTLEPGTEAEATQTPIADVSDLAVVTATPVNTPTPTPATEDNFTQEEISLTATSAMATAHPDLVPPPGEFFTPTPVPPFPGMVFETQARLSQIGEDWQPQQLMLLLPSFRGVALSPDGTRVVYADQGDLWLTTLADGVTTQLTNTPEHDERYPQWWSAHPDILLFQSLPLAQAQETQARGYLAAMSLSEGWLTLLEDEEMSGENFAPSYNGLHIAYDRGGEAWLYHWDLQQSEPFYEASYAGSPPVTWLRLGSPSWSPDSNKLAWMVRVQGDEFPALDGSGQAAAAIFDLTTSTYTILHPYDNAGRGGWFAAAVWSPDNQWLAFVAEDVDPARAGVWVVKTDGSEEHYLGPGSNPVWSPDGQWLTYQGVTPQLVETTFWYALNLFVYEDGLVVDWR